jgi:CRP/FNR family transcriptional regulator
MTIDYSIFDLIFEKDLKNEIQEVSKVVFFKADDIIIDYGDDIKGVPIILEGAIKVMREDFNDGEMIMYFLSKEDTCALTLQCCMSKAKSEIRAVAETDGHFLMIPIGKVHEWMKKYETWRFFIIKNYDKRLKEMLITIDSIAFMKLDQRLLHYLQEKAVVNKSKTLEVTHQKISEDLNTSRVVVSRLLKTLENMKVIKQERSLIHLL